MKAECKEHEAVIVERVEKIVDDKVNIAVTNRLVPINRWITGSIIGSLAFLIVIFIHNSNALVKLDTQYTGLKESIDQQNIIIKESITKSETTQEKQDEINLTFLEKLNDIDKKQYYIGFGVKQINPDFNIDGLRGKTIKN